MKKVSIIVPVYNGEKYIKRCLESLIKQTYENIEIIVIDDGSTDESGNICDEYSLIHHNCKVHHVPNGGVSAARNQGIECAEGSYLTFVDADDYLKSDMVARLVKLLEETGSDVAGCGYQAFAEENEIQHQQPESNNRKEIHEVLSGDEFIEKGILASDTRCWSKLYTRASIGDSRYNEEFTIGEDMLFLLEIACKSILICRTTYKGYYYFLNESGAMKLDFKESYMDQIVCWQKAAEQIRERRPDLEAEVTSIILISIMLVVGKLALISGKERMKYKKNINYCLQQVKLYEKIEGAYHNLPKGYKVKVAIFRWNPAIYIKGYHFWKHVKKAGKE